MTGVQTCALPISGGLRPCFLVSGEVDHALDEILDGNLEDFELDSECLGDVGCDYKGVTENFIHCPNATLELK